MFFSPELLARRDSGFGLLWLAATLGSKSTFKKLSKRSVLTADITQLCDLIAEPAEPLALRLSSNLMVGVARVYKVKQEILMTDITNCVSSLKKVVQELHSAALMDAQLQMAQSSVRPSALTLVADPKTAYIMDFDTLVADWDEFLNIGDKVPAAYDAADDDFNPNSKQAKRKGKVSVTENLRADIHTLKEHHDHLLSASFDLSLNGNASIDPSSSQAEGFILDDNFFPHSDGLDIGGLGDELARELGEGWGEFADQTNMELDFHTDTVANGIPMDFNFASDDDPFERAPPEMSISRASVVPATPRKTPLKRKTISGSDKENLLPSLVRGPHFPTTFSPATSFSRMLLSQDAEEALAHPLLDITANNQNQNTKKFKRTRLLLDARTELTDEELKVVSYSSGQSDDELNVCICQTARAQYLEGQGVLRREIYLKKSNKDSGKVIEDMVWGVPQGVQAHALVEFWQENFKVQVEARTGALLIHPSNEPSSKRRKIRALSHIDEMADDILNHGPAYGMDEDVMMGTDIDQDIQGMGLDGDYYGGGDVDRGLRSSEEPGQGRRVSRPPSVLGANFDFDLGPHDPPTGSQRSSMFPWDNAGPSSSCAAPFAGSDRISVDRAEIKLRGSSLSRRESSLVPSQVGSGIGPGFSPGAFVKNSQIAFGEDYAFDVGDGHENVNENNATQLESQRSEMNLITLERNSFNFLEYVKMQLQTLPSSATNVSFDTIVPSTTSTRHVAAAAFYHCLVLATKDLVRLQQHVPHGPLSVAIA